MDFEKENAFIASHYLESFKNAANEHQAVDSSEVSHRKRFDKMFEIGDLQGKSVLDVGCGLGAFYGYLKERGIKCDYTGFDLVPDMIETARQKYPEIKDRFSVFNILHEDVERRFDYVISVTPITLKLASGQNMEISMKLMQSMYRLASVGMAMSMTSAFTKKPNDHTYYYDPLSILEEVFKISRNVKFDHTYLPHDFTVFCYKKDLYNF